MPNKTIPHPLVSIVIPVYNEEAGLQALFDRLYPAMDALNTSYEIIFINDGSRDRSAAILSDQYHKRKDVTRVILFNGNFGQHRAILAGFAHSRGERIVTLDADLQNPPEDIGSLLAEMDKGHDYVGSIRRQRNDSLWRHLASRAMNRLREKLTRIKMTDQGCMMRAYSRRIIDTINQCQEMHTFIPALAYSFAQNPTEVVVGHEERHAGESKYSLYSLIRLNFDLMTGFSIVPLQMFSMLGMLVSFFAGLLVVYLIGRRIIIGPEAEGLFTLEAILMFLIGLSLFGIGILGEYIGRIYQEVRERPRYLISAILQEQELDERR
ncbi:undecaprenyl-phosphate 4-deoxy-4-formamido-L-arabinose transferase [Formivibrio citricus]|uniref:Undecaprenyl-phosphate 4-deoxy-4-formamido-L-arabinose transferase n=1 Tax=Formivibrio citricus TaxID=83765 RepID=A0A1I4Y3B8_9NEIS|nr:glycosyltransferase [Formivibrio citricus]SFN32584.1 undecaprenyl-phosphate 4-deoxy-4-formamido-L-arabinose transferase [Formivibrio citricus]